MLNYSDAYVSAVGEIRLLASDQLILYVLKKSKTLFRGTTLRKKANGHSFLINSLSLPSSFCLFPYFSLPGMSFVLEIRKYKVLELTYEVTRKFKLNTCLFVSMADMGPGKLFKHCLSCVCLLCFAVDLRPSFHCLGNSTNKHHWISRQETSSICKIWREVQFKKFSKFQHYCEVTTVTFCQKTSM